MMQWRSYLLQLRHDTAKEVKKKKKTQWELKKNIAKWKQQHKINAN